MRLCSHDAITQMVGSSQGQICYKQQWIKLTTFWVLLFVFTE